MLKPNKTPQSFVLNQKVTINYFRFDAFFQAYFKERAISIYISIAVGFKWCKEYAKYPNEKSTISRENSFFLYKIWIKKAMLHSIGFSI